MSSTGDVLALAVFVIEGQRYALPVSVVERVLPMVAVSPLPQAPAVVLGVISVHGQVVPVTDFRRRVGLAPREYGVGSHLLVARTRRRTLALAVDEALGVRDVPSEAVTGTDALLPGIGHVAGIVALPDGLLYVHDLETFLSLDEERGLSDALAGAGR